MNIIRKDSEDIKNQLELLEMKIKISEVKKYTGWD